METRKSERRVQRSFTLDPDLDHWLREYARAASASESTVVRQALRAMKRATEEKAA